MLSQVRNEMVQNVNNYIKSLNFGYRADLIENGVKYLNMYARFIDNHTIEATDSKGNKVFSHITLT